jgi:hypothetical protein
MSARKFKKLIIAILVQKSGQTNIQLYSQKFILNIDVPV